MLLNKQVEILLKNDIKEYNSREAINQKLLTPLWVYGEFFCFKKFS